MITTVDPFATELLYLSARLTGDEATYARLGQLAGKITDWRQLLATAEQFNMGPLLYTHLRAAQAPVPTGHWRELKGVYLRHRQTNQVRSGVLSEIVALFEAHSIQMLLLKGAALAHLVYPRPGLRPMRDMDLLVHPDQVWEAQRLLAEAGFNAPQRYITGKTYHHHLAEATKKVEGLTITVELHHTVFLAELGLSLDIETLTAPPVALTLPDGRLAYALGPADMLWHVSHHLADIWQPFRWIWLVDMVATAEKFVDDIDWVQVNRRYPRITANLSLFHTVTPLSPHLQKTARIATGFPPPGIGREFRGWPRYSVDLLRQQHGWFEVIRETLLPPEWWLRLYYGLGAGQSPALTRWVRHPLHIAAYGRQLLRERFA
jgi:hypothetical protein